MGTKDRIAERTFIIVAAFMATSACQKDGYAPSAPITGAYQLVYGNSQSDRALLLDRIAGNSPPKFGEVISRWRRFSGPNYYADPSAIVANPTYCQTTLDNAGSWSMGSNGGTPVNPNTANACNTASMNSLSWIYLTGPDRLFNIQNTTNYNGFFSSLKFENYIGEATVSSGDTDDDAIGVTVAVYVDGSNNVHTLSAYRTHGGQPPLSGWGLLHKTNNTVTRVIGNMSVGGIFKNGSAGDNLGWNGRNTKIRIERAGSIVKAYASTWATGATALPVDPASLIEIDLANPSENLTEFVGAQGYGYETISQARATFSDLTFMTPQSVADPAYLFDLKMNVVYIKKNSGIGYELLPGAGALGLLGYPKTITNLETQREFLITSSNNFTEL